MRALDLRIERHRHAGADHALDAESAAVSPGAAGIWNELVALDHDRELDFGLFARTVMRIAVVDAYGGGDTVLVALRAPAAAQRPEIGEEEFRGFGVDAVQRGDQQIGMMPGDDTVWNNRRQRLEHRIDDGHRVGHPPAHRRWPDRADDAARRNDCFQVA